jgi:hypothetical protein
MRRTIQTKLLEFFIQVNHQIIVQFQYLHGWDTLCCPPISAHRKIKLARSTRKIPHRATCQGNQTATRQLLLDIFPC